MQALMDDMVKGEFDVIVSEALDRLSRDQEDTAHIFKRAEYTDVEIDTLSEGIVNSLHIGITSTMNAMQVKETARKVKRGMQGRVLAGKSAGGIPYGYRTVKKFDAEGNLIRGDREIVDEQAEIILRILESYASGMSPKAIAKELNDEGVPSPTKKQWSQSSINGHRQRGTGILNNEAYVGVLVWNRQKFVKNPSTGKREPRFNPQEEWVLYDVPEWRIVPQELWDRVKERQKAMKPIGEKFWKAKRPKYLLSGLLKCGECGGGFAKANHDRYGCATRANKGTCDNTLKIKASDLEARVTHALNKTLMDPELCGVFADEYVKHMNDLRRRQNETVDRYKAKLEKNIKAQKTIIEAIKEGLLTEQMKEETKALAMEELDLKRKIETADELPPMLHPAMGEHYRKQVTQAIQLLNSENDKTEAHEILRELIEKVVLTPNNDRSELIVDLHGDLAGIMSMATNAENSKVSNGYDVMVGKLVAEEGLEPPTRGL